MPNDGPFDVTPVLIDDDVVVENDDVPWIDADDVFCDDAVYNTDDVLLEPDADAEAVNFTLEADYDA